MLILAQMKPINIVTLGASKHVQDAEKYKLGHPSLFHYLNQSKTYELEGVSSADEYLKTRRAMDIVGISSEDQVGWFYQKLMVILFLLLCCSCSLLIRGTFMLFTGSYFSHIGRNSASGKY